MRRGGSPSGLFRLLFDFQPEFRQPLTLPHGNCWLEPETSQQEQDAYQERHQMMQKRRGITGEP